MARHSQAQASRAKEPSRIPAWVWLFTGAMLGAFVMFLLHLSDSAPSKEPPAKPNTSQKEDIQKPRFDFYELLKDSDIPILSKPKANKENSGQAPAPSFEFLLQVASFKSMPDAEQLRAELVLLNLEAYTERAKIRNGETWHRVLVGPFTSKSKLSKARSILLSNRHEALVLKRRH